MLPRLRVIRELILAVAVVRALTVLPAARVDPMSVPRTIGVVGVGTISSATVKGLFAAFPDEGGPTFVLSPRNDAKARALVEACGAGRASIAPDNQAVVDGAECVILAVLPGQAEGVLRELKFRGDQLVVSLMAGVPLARIRDLTGCARACVAMPLPPVATRNGCTIVVPDDEPSALALFRAVGKAVPVPDEAQFKRLQAMTCLMGDLYERQRTAQTWLTKNGVGADAAAAFVGGIFRTITTDSADAAPETLAHLVAEQTPGGMNEMVIAEQRADGSYESLQHSLNSIYSRLDGAHDPNLAPAKKRRVD